MNDVFRLLVGEVPPETCFRVAEIVDALRDLKMIAHDAEPIIGENSDLLLKVVFRRHVPVKARSRRAAVVRRMRP